MRKRRGRMRWLGKELQGDGRGARERGGLGEEFLTKYGNMNEEKYLHLPFDKWGLNLVE